MATWQDRMTSQRVRNEVRRGREALGAGRKEEKRRKKEGGKTVSKGQQPLLALRASMLGPGADRGPVAHGRGRVLVSCPDGLVQNPGVWGSSQGLVFEHVRKHEKVPVGQMPEAWVGIAVLRTRSALVMSMTSFRSRYVSSRLDSKWVRYKRKSVFPQIRKPI